MLACQGIIQAPLEGLQTYPVRNLLVLLDLQSSPTVVTHIRLVPWVSWYGKLQRRGTKQSSPNRRVVSASLQLHSMVPGASPFLEGEKHVVLDDAILCI